MSTSILCVTIFCYTVWSSANLHLVNALKEYKMASDYFENNPEEQDHLLEGDIVETPNLFQTNSSNNVNGSLSDIRNGIRSKNSRWIGGVIPYQFSSTIPPEQREVLMKAFAEFQKKTCIRFRLHLFESDYLVFTSTPNGCWSRIGRQGGRQVINFEIPICFRKFGTILHELMHAVGFFHEQNRYERDSYVQVLYQNIRTDMKRNFDKIEREKATGYGIPYDYGSVMHYKLNSFSRNGKPTLKSLKTVPQNVKIGQRVGFSPGDIKKIRAMYKCYRLR